jgi:hypothetical protein
VLTEVLPKKTGASTLLTRLLEVNLMTRGLTLTGAVYKLHEDSIKALYKDGKSGWAGEEKGGFV